MIPWATYMHATVRNYEIVEFYSEEIKLSDKLLVSFDTVNL